MAVAIRDAEELIADAAGDDAQGLVRLRRCPRRRRTGSCGSTCGRGVAAGGVCARAAAVRTRCRNPPVRADTDGAALREGPGGRSRGPRSRRRAHVRNPAVIAACWPKFLLRRIARTRESRAAICSSTAHAPSRLRSSTSTSSKPPGTSSKLAATRSTSSSRKARAPIHRDDDADLGRQGRAHRREPIPRVRSSG